MFNATSGFGIWAGLAASTVALAGPANVNIGWRYQDATTGKVESKVVSAAVPAVSISGALEATDPVIAKTIYLVKVASSLKDAMAEYSVACKDSTAKEEGELADMPLPKCLEAEARDAKPMPPRCRPPVVVPSVCEAKRKAVAERLFARVAELQKEVSYLRPHVTDKKVYEALDIARKLADNMRELAGRRFYPYPEHDGFPIPRKGGMPSRGLPAPAPSMPKGAGGAGMSVTAGGAKDWAFVRKLIADGQVPHPENLVVEGFLSEFDLQPALAGCKELICLQPVVAVHPASRKLYVQLGMSSGVSVESFKRKPLNLSIVIDISGSMSAADGTEKNRLEWAKDAALRTLEKLGEADVVSVVLFDSESQVLVPPTVPVGAARAEIEAKIRALQPRGSTNVEAGLRDAYRLLSPKVAQGVESRVILISDAGLNTGATDEATFLRMIGEHAHEGIGLTAIGLGENFNQGFVHAVTRSLGGNYIYAHSGLGMVDYFVNFDFLVSPVAYNFKAVLAIDGLKAKLKAAYGVPADDSKAAAKLEVIDIRTLFFAGTSGGGAVLLEYDLAD